MIPLCIIVDIKSKFFFQSFERQSEDVSIKKIHIVRCLNRDVQEEDYILQNILAHPC